jgi:nitrate/nitrite transporter NarK
MAFPMTRARALILVTIAELFAMSPWFAVSAVAPQIAAESRLDVATTTWLTIAARVRARHPKAV